MLQELLPYATLLLQWARARQRFPEMWYAVIVVGLSFGFYVWATPTPFAGPWQGIVAGWWEQAKTILALTQGVSTASNIAVAFKPSLANVLPVTNSIK